MKGIFIVLILPLAVFCQKPVQYSFSVSKSGFSNGKEVFIAPAVFTPGNEYNDAGLEVVSMISNQKRLQGSLSYATPISFSYIKQEGNRKQVVTSDFLFLDSGSFRISLSPFRNDHNFHRQVNSKSNLEYERLKMLYQSLEINTSATSVLNMGNVLKKDKILEAYVQQHPDSYVAMWVLINDYQEYGYSDTKETIARLFSKEISATRPMLALNDKINKGKLLTVNQRFPFQYFHFGDNMRNVVMKAKYTLVDFWASYCKPCIAELPALKKIYADGKSNGFEVFSVSLDNKLNLPGMDSIIKQQDLSWTNVVDLNGAESIRLNIFAIPRNFLLDSTGKIIATNISMQSLGLFLKPEAGPSKLSFNRHVVGF